MRAIPLFASAFAALVIPDVSGASAVSCRDVADALEGGKPPDQVATDLKVAAAYVKWCASVSPGCRRINDALTAGKTVDEVASDMDLPALVVRQCSQLRELGDWMQRSLNAGTGPLVPRVSALLDQVPHTWQASRCHVRPNVPAPNTSKPFHTNVCQ